MDKQAAELRNDLKGATVERVGHRVGLGERHRVEIAARERILDDAHVVTARRGVDRLHVARLPRQMNRYDDLRSQELPTSPGEPARTRE